MDKRITVRVQAEPFDLTQEIDAIVGSRSDLGAVVTFTGLCRDEGGALSALELEHYPGMAEEEIGRIADQALQKWPVEGLSIIHRFGRILPSEPIVLVVAASVHREAAFNAANFAMDFLKSQAPFWKKESQSGDQDEGWVEARECDDLARDRWSNNDQSGPERS